VARFLLDIRAGDYVFTPAADTELLHYGQIEPDPSYFYAAGDDGCPYRHRRRVQWAAGTLHRSGFSVPLQNTIRSSLTVFAVSQRDEFLAAIGRQDLVASPKPAKYDPYLAVLEQVLELDPTEFEILVGHLLTALGFEGSEVTGRTGDGGVDATGELNVANLAKVKVFVQAKRYKLGSRVSASTVRALRQAIPRDGQGAFITTADFDRKASEIALDPNFPRIGLVNGRQLVDLIVEHWNEIPPAFQERLALRQGLVRA
jgi:predicted Mrr-cat superfamily restriction endonuclease